MKKDQATAKTQHQTKTGNKSSQNSGSAQHLAQELEKAKEQLAKMTEISQRALADLQNYKRRSEEDKAEFAAFANAALFSELIPVIESATRALAHENKDAEWAKGVEQTLQQLIQACEKAGLQKIKAEGQFDPTKHEALLTAPGAKDQILEILENGYMLGDKVLKPARVKVGSG